MSIIIMENAKTKIIPETFISKILTTHYDINISSINNQISNVHEQTCTTAFLIPILCLSP